MVRKTQRTGTFKLFIGAIVIFLVGFGLGSVVNVRSYLGRVGRLPGDEEPAQPGKSARKPDQASRAKPAKAVPADTDLEASDTDLEAPRSETKAVKPAARTEPRSALPPPAKAEAEARPAAQPAGLPRIALVIDDLGYAPPELVTRLCAQAIPFDVAVLPYLEFTHQSAEIAHGRGKEVMLHLPMEPMGYPAPGKDPGRDAILWDLPEAQVRERVRKAMDDIPFRQGVNNHMGSKITPDRTRMNWVLQEIKARNYFFIDSRSTKDSVAYAVAEQLGIRAAERKVFLDDDKDPAAITKQWDRALALAHAEGQVVVIGHIYPETVTVLETLVPAARSSVTFVKASALVH
jgi:polysaccharide deacetylase 2 family uncharacterized protein YibQ